MVDLCSYLKPLPYGVIRCSACGFCYTIHNRDRNKPGNPQPKNINFILCGCKKCGHLMRATSDTAARDLTRSEVTELVASPDFPYVRRVVQNAVRNLWG